MPEQEIAGVARFLGTVPNDHRIFQIMYPDDLELYQLDPPLGGYRVAAAARCVPARRPTYVGDPIPPEDPVSTYLYGTTGGEGLQIEWKDELLKAAGRAPVRALSEAGYRVWQ